ncbi:MAG TPA: hypothetical protein VHY76_06165 [Acetobacteraceae bacterium]|nr:hypothetical protein [Acetobacteraceae bacterium]
MRAALLVTLALLTAAPLAGCATSRYASLGRQDAQAIMAGMAMAHRQSESLARSAPRPDRGL